MTEKRERVQNILLINTRDDKSGNERDASSRGCKNTEPLQNYILLNKKVPTSQVSTSRRQGNTLSVSRVSDARKS